jgi:hypothetical protein
VSNFNEKATKQIGQIETVLQISQHKMKKPAAALAARAL